ncbi:MAG: flavodoxin family protein [Promethearchaeota archaeon]|nr:MAG: flavodoxin family protein [Candidatus Lokiarchaeota archaeon]
MKILGIMGSPRKNGNTHILISKILEGAQDSGASIEILLLGDLEIKECDGCHSCWKGNECSKLDDMNSIFPKIIDSDVLIFGTPVYWYGPTSLIKAFLDRFVYFNCAENREKIKEIIAILVIPFEEENLETARPLVEMFEKSLNYLEIPLIEKFLVPGVTKRGEVAQKIKIMEKCYNIGKELVMIK